MARVSMFRRARRASSLVALALSWSAFAAAPVANENPARPPDKPAVGELGVQPLRPGLQLVTGAGGNVVVWSGHDGTVLVDTGLASQAMELVATVARVAPGPLRFVVNTHGHADHVGGNVAAVEAGAVVVGHEGLRDYAGSDAAVPEGVAGAGTMAAARPVVALTDSLALHLNGDRLLALHAADAHTSSDVVVRWSAADVVALGDIYWSWQYPAIDLGSGGSLAGMVAAVEGTLARSTPRTVIVPGHGAPSGKADLAAYRDMLVGVGRKVREAVERGETLEAILAAHPTAEFDERFARPGAYVPPDEFVRCVYEDLTRAARGR